jgi:hypothetical protein
MAEKKRRHSQGGAAARVWVLQPVAATKRRGFGCSNHHQQQLSLSLWSMAKGGGQERVVVVAAL